jgi:hypothetical protein
MTSLLEKKEINLRLGGSNDMIYGQSFSISENGPGWVATFHSRKWPKISGEHAFSSSENGPDQTSIFVMKMV